MPVSELSGVGAVVVHYRNFPTIIRTVESLIEQGIDAGSIVVVDNSDDADVAASVRNGVPPRVRTLALPNPGYGAAANEGAKLLAADDEPPAFVLIATHEVEPLAGAVRLLHAAISVAPDVGVVGPTLIGDYDGSAVVWSRGGTHSRWLNEPQHVDHRVAWVPEAHASGSDSGAAVERDWLDGAFCLYRADALVEHPFDEDYFLYVEEADLHARLKRAGLRVQWVAGAVVREHAQGCPPYLLCRNSQIYQARFGPRRARYAAVPWILTRRSVRKTLRGGRPRERRDMLRGWVHGLRRSRRLRSV